jgi:hypothetical protein
LAPRCINNNTETQELQKTGNPTPKLNNSTVTNINNSDISDKEFKKKDYKNTSKIKEDMKNCLNKFKRTQIKS